MFRTIIRQLHELLDRQREGALTPAEAEELMTLLQLNDQGLPVKAEALADRVSALYFY